MFSIQLARQGQTMEQGTIVRWLKQPGEDIRIGEELYEIETEKAVAPDERRCCRRHVVHPVRVRLQFGQHVGRTDMELIDGEP